MKRDEKRKAKRKKLKKEEIFFTHKFHVKTESFSCELEKWL